MARVHYHLLGAGNPSMPYRTLGAARPALLAQRRAYRAAGWAAKKCDDQADCYLMAAPDGKTERRVYVDPCMRSDCAERIEDVRVSPAEATEQGDSGEPVRETPEAVEQVRGQLAEIDQEASHAQALMAVELVTKVRGGEVLFGRYPDRETALLVRLAEIQSYLDGDGWHVAEGDPSRSGEVTLVAAWDAKIAFMVREGES